MKLLYFASLSHGGLADYAREQIAALARAGVTVEVLCAPSFPEIKAEVTRHNLLPDPGRGESNGGRLKRAWRFMRLMVGQHRVLARFTRDRGFEHVLLGSYAEYFAPFWSAGLRALARRGVVFGAVVHDPVRDAVLGPRWWHRRSIGSAYSFLSHAFVHEAVLLETIRPVPGLKMTVIPHGAFCIATETPSREDARASLGLPLEAPVLLSFGHIRDNKNLDLTIQALKGVPELHLLIAGSELSSGQQPVSFYRELAQAQGVSGRCHWQVRFIPEHEIGMFFAAADFISLTYSSSFRSASGVLSLSSQFRKPCIASSGAGPLGKLVRKYQLGVWVEPDDGEALGRGLRHLLAAAPEPKWDAYVSDNSWEQNARIVAHTFFGAAA